MFKSAHRRSAMQKLAASLWPRTGLQRAWSYRMKRLSRLKVSEHRVSLGFAAGAFASFTPFIGFHFIIAGLLAFFVRGNVVASAVGTVVGNPLTFPFIWLSTYQLGTALLGQTAGEADAAVSGSASLAGLAAASGGGVLQSIGPMLLPMVVGAVPLGLACAAACYAIIYVTLRQIRGRRRQPRTISGVAVEPT